MWRVLPDLSNQLNTFLLFLLFSMLTTPSSFIPLHENQKLIWKTIAVSTQAGSNITSPVKQPNRSSSQDVIYFQVIASFPLIYFSDISHRGFPGCTFDQTSTPAAQCYGSEPPGDTPLLQERDIPPLPTELIENPHLEAHQLWAYKLSTPSKQPEAITITFPHSAVSPDPPIAVHKHKVSSQTFQLSRKSRNHNDKFWENSDSAGCSIHKLSR